MSHGQLGELMINLDVVYETVYGRSKMSYSYLYNLFSNMCEYMSAYICVYTHTYMDKCVYTYAVGINQIKSYLKT